MRLFISIDLEEESILKKIRHLQGKVSLEGIRLVNTELMHITLKFLGEQREDRVLEIQNELSDIQFRKFKVNFVGMGSFPRVIWVGIEEGRNEMINLARNVDSKMSELGFPRERRRFSPHLTIGRIKRAPSPVLSELKMIVRDHSREPVGSFEVPEIRLKKSTLTPQGPIYETLFAVPGQEN